MQCSRLTAKLSLPIFNPDLLHHTLVHSRNENNAGRYSVCCIAATTIAVRAWQTRSLTHSLTHSPQLYFLSLSVALSLSRGRIRVCKPPASSTRPDLSVSLPYHGGRRCQSVSPVLAITQASPIDAARVPERLVPALGWCTIFLEHRESRRDRNPCTSHTSHTSHITHPTLRVRLAAHMHPALPCAVRYVPLVLIWSLVSLSEAFSIFTMMLPGTECNATMGRSLYSR
ncbi:hypothetical protein K431DRAFT_43811 [Polychaeton citri CBS 116435]|uniref:Uncharacterized protein n=1 Tax=Polychaeton citri CBS 116435 TaxID=1314669 RepID=A0A9P4QAP8_9PEZI|nr:hypothetical protein K431DRAFT_43811 [Polychaeton citri CBS 116435]